MSDVEKFIELVRKRPFLYDLSHNDYKDRQKKADAWGAIACEMESEDGNYWCSKWKTLRDNYNKYRKTKQTLSCPSYKKYRNWPWSESMRFLDGCPDRRTSFSNINMSNQNSTQTYFQCLASISYEQAENSHASGSQVLINEEVDEAESSCASDSKVSTSEEVGENIITSGSEVHANQKENNCHVSDTKVTINEDVKNTIASGFQEPVLTEYKGDESSAKRKKRKVNREDTNAILKYIKEEQAQNKRELDEIDLFFQSYAKNFRRLSRKSQALIKVDIASLFTRYELQMENADT